MTGSIAERPHSPDGPVLRRLADILPQTDPAAAPQPTPVAERVADPTAPAQVDRMLRAAVEIIGGRRPARQLADIVHPDLLSYLLSLQATAGPLQPRVRKVLARHQGPGTLEAVALVTLRTGVRALAARFEEHVDADGNRWRCTALQLRLTAGDIAARRRLR